jgi:exodeoxyribonuclease V beta subunit
MDEEDEKLYGGALMAKRLRSIYDLDWESRCIIEANAGTGKTYTIVGLFLRLLLEKGLEIDQILVVTFTRKAASELRERILTALRKAEKAFEGDSEPDDLFLQEMVARTEEREEASRMIRQAILNFDESLISTIHGFCQKVLREEALLAGSSFDAEVTRSDQELEEAVSDFWRIYSAENSDSAIGRFKLETLYKFGKTPEDLLKKLKLLFSKPYADVEGSSHPDPDRLIGDMLRLREQMALSWNTHKEFIRKEFLDNDLKSFSHRTESRMKKMDSFLEKPLYEISQIDQLKYFRWSYLNDDNNLTSKGTRKPAHCPFFDLADNYSELMERAGALKTTLLLDIYERIYRRRSELKNNSETYSYDDLLIKLRDSLSRGANADSLARKLRNRYPVALVDEFQDTDPVQYEIFGSIYPTTGGDTSLLMIGDPKQAIYNFRGADVFAYLSAKDELEGGIYELRDNYRSSRQLIEGVNALFTCSENPFAASRITYRPSGVGVDKLAEQFVRAGQPMPGLHFTMLEPFYSNKEELRQNLVYRTVAEAGELLEEGELKIFDESEQQIRRLQPGDIAILVAKNRDAEHVKRELKRIGLGAVTYSRENVFQSFEAVRLHILMEAVLHPNGGSKAGNLLVSGFYGFDGNRLAASLSDDEGLSAISDKLQELNEIWYTKGFYPMIRKLLFEDRKLHHFASQPNSERVLTNLFHLADLCSRAEQQEALSMSELYDWFTDEIRNKDEEDDEKTQLLESDQKLIKILTVHSSKGLEFPVVFCPYLWEGTYRLKRDDFHEYHDNDNRLKINVDYQMDDEAAEALKRSMMESISEEARKAYVALTRAKYHCRVVWGSHTDSNISGLGPILLGSYFVERNRDNNLGDKEKQISPENESADQLPEFQAYSGPAEIRRGQRLESFSSLNSHGDASQPDYDQVLDRYISFLETDEPEKRKYTIFEFPKGATPGTAIHKLFEHEDFSFSTASESDLIPIAKEVLEEYHLDTKWAETLQVMIRQVSGSVIGSLRMEEIERSDEIREMEFHFPSNNVNLENILEIIREGLPAESSLNGLHNYLTGFIDLIVRQNGKYYILDYKSNYLGDSVDDYTTERLREEITSANYDLQYHIYTVALRKYLAARDPGFNYERDFGGVAYLFVRGMESGTDSGVWFDKPDIQVIDELERALTAKEVNN